jgi:signal transduction histidine kinase
MAVRTRTPRPRSIRFTLAALLIIPLLSLVGLWAYAASLTLGNALTDRQYNSLVTRGEGPSNALLQGISQEREDSYIWLTTGSRAAFTAMIADRQRTDAAVAGYRRLTAQETGAEPAAAATAQRALVADLGKLPGLRTTVNAAVISPIHAFQAYSALINALFAYYEANTNQQVTLYRQTMAGIDSARAMELVGREIGLMAAAEATNGRMSEPARALFASDAAEQQTLVSQALTLFSQPAQGEWSRLYASPQGVQFAGLENHVAASVGQPGRLPVSLNAWRAASATFLTYMQSAEQDQSAALAQLSDRLGDRLLLDAVLAGGLGLLAVAAAVLLTVRYGRRLTRELTGLDDTAQAIASTRLPAVVARLRRGDEVDVSAESPPPVPGRITEIAKVAQSFATVQRTAVEAAVGQANLRKGVNQVFLNLSLRNQSLLHRQLSMLDSMERAASEPAALEELFRLDHLTTRMRRHAEGLIILSGATPGRGWRDPVPVVDVLRAAVAEVEDYVRVDVVSESGDSIVGPAVNDVIHLMAELIENATSFSPPNTQVEVRADAVGTGFAVEVEDRGLGLTPPELAAINERLASPPEFDLANSDQLGLFVVGQLAARHGIKVTLRESPYQGIRAIVVMPHSIIVPAAGADDPVTGDLRPATPLPAAPPPEPIANRARASVFSPTGRHRLPSEPPAAEAAPEPVTPAESSAPAGPARAAPASTDEEAGRTHLGLPVRVRQASIAPQLRTDAPESTGLAPARPSLEIRSPEHARSLMAALQEGWRQGRTDDMDEPGRPAEDPYDGEATS